MVHMSSYSSSNSSNGNNNLQQQQQQGQGEHHVFFHDEVVFIENVLVELRSLIPNDQGENNEILEKIVMAEQILGARLDSEATEIGDSA